MDKILAKQVLFEIDDIFKKYGIVYWLDCGTLLGAIREKDFITWDINDVDIGMYRCLPLEYKLWYSLLKDFADKNIKVEIVWDDSVFSAKKIQGKKRMILDVHTFKRRGKEYHIEMKNKLFFFPEECFKTLDEIEFLGRKFKVPHNPEKYLACLYGTDWKIPNPHKKIWSSKHSKPFPYKYLIKYDKYIPIFEKKEFNND